MTRLAAVSFIAAGCATLAATALGWHWWSAAGAVAAYVTVMFLTRSAWLPGLHFRPVCQHCDRPSRSGDRLVRRDGYRVHRSCIEHPASAFRTWSLS